MVVYIPRRARIFFILIFLSMMIRISWAAEQSETERLIRRITPPLSLLEEKPKKKEEWLIDFFEEPSDIVQGSRRGHWNELTNTIGYKYENIQSYFSASRFERFDDDDYTASIGSYISMKDSYAHMEAGFGWDVDYMYKLQSIIEYGHRIYKTVYLQAGYNYRDYDSGDTHLVYPGIIYYFGDNYISVDYGASGIEGRGLANFGTVKGNFAITSFLDWMGGIAFGERLYDIYGFDRASAERGFILFTGVNMEIYKDIKFRVGYSYGTEAPKFIKRSVNFGISAKF